MRRQAVAAAGVLVLAGAAWWWWSRRKPADGLEEVSVNLQRRPEPGGVVDAIGQGVNAAADAAAAVGDSLLAGARSAAGAVADFLIPRGIRNNNPGNIRRGADQWQGQANPQTDAAFIQFVDPIWGIRAIARIVGNYSARGLKSVRQIIGTWAPPSENNTAAYVDAVARALGVNPDAPLDLGAALPDLVAAIIRHENGQQPYTAAQIAEGIRRAQA